uniref:Uncharacterized protein n=1 Tax=Lepeophtheirus salmonis TaxID=72036 RepID=A0A0K2US29_LEPSM
MMFGIVSVTILVPRWIQIG